MGPLTPTGNDTASFGPFQGFKAKLTIPIVDAAPRHRTTDFLVGFSSTITLVAGSISDTISTRSSSSSSETRKRSGSSRQRDTRRSFVTTCDAKLMIKRCASLTVSFRSRLKPKLQVKKSAYVGNTSCLGTRKLISIGPG